MTVATTTPKTREKATSEAKDMRTAHHRRGCVVKDGPILLASGFTSRIVLRLMARHALLGDVR